jgi:hypothetical protein
VVSSNYVPGREKESWVQNVMWAENWKKRMSKSGPQQGLVILPQVLWKSLVGSEKGVKQSMFSMGHSGFSMEKVERREAGTAVIFSSLLRDLDTQNYLLNIIQRINCYTFVDHIYQRQQLLVSLLVDLVLLIYPCVSKILCFTHK